MRVHFLYWYVQVKFTGTVFRSNHVNFVEKLTINQVGETEGSLFHTCVNGI